MRKLSILVILAALVLSPMAGMAKDKDIPAQTAGGFAGPITGAEADTVVKAKELRDDAPVVLTGHILSQIVGKKKKFLFKDQTGEIVLDIDKKAFRGQTVTPEDTVRLLGKVDKDWGDDLEIDVKQVEILKQ